MFLDHSTTMLRNATHTVVASGEECLLAGGSVRCADPTKPTVTSHQSARLPKV